MSHKSPNLIPSPQPEILHDSGSPDPIDIIPRPSKQSGDASASDVDSDPSPPVCALKRRGIMRQPPPRGQSDEEWSPPIRRPLNSGRFLEQSPESDEVDSSLGALPVHATPVHDASVGVGRKFDFEASELPRAVSPDVKGLFGKIVEGPSSLPPVSPPEPEIQSEQSSTEEEDKPLIPPLPSLSPPCVWHSGDGVGAVLVPARDDSKFPYELQEAERTMAAQIASALSDPRDEGLGSATFQTLLDAFLLPRLKGRNSKGHRVKIHQYSQLAARRRQLQSETARENAQRDLDTLARMYKLDTNDAANLDAVAQRRVPDMTSMAVFEEKVPMPDGQTYRLIAHRGPKMCITEIKSFNWGGNPDILDHDLALAVDKAHKQNYVAAQFLFIEDEHLKHVASFVGVGPVWLYGE